ncbi:MAG: Hdr-like menaquinol oxidoreductase cytochrome c subunit [Rhodobacteraceae bacterium]|nr:Hdr-like menaquinol oxidoreductase cytochrome c subunit [Paracoccaceae bacterium]
MSSLKTLLLIAAMMLGDSALAGDTSLLPEIPRGNGDACVADATFMRINHMNLLKHDRDDTVYLGDREIKHSLKECIACHAVSGPDAKPVSIKNEKHFCRVCHDFAAVKIDCFQCHNSRPGTQTDALFTQPVPDRKKLATYLEEALE